MRYEIIIPKKVAKQIKALPSKVRDKIIEKLTLLKENPRPSGTKKLEGYETIYRLRVGDYRVVYDIEDDKLVILIVNCQHRKDVYKNL